MFSKCKFYTVYDNLYIDNLQCGINYKLFFIVEIHG